jgi:hypothetical protein
MHAPIIQSNHARARGAKKINRKIRRAQTTTLGPAGVSANQESAIPPTTAIDPSILAKIAICSGVAEIRLAAAAGIINSEVISSTPTSFIAPAMTMAINSISASL